MKTLAYWPFEDEHGGEGPLLASVLVVSCLLLGIVASFQNLFLGLGLATGCLYGSALARYFSR